MSDPISVEELPVLQSISALKLKDGDILVVKLLAAFKRVEQVRPLMEKQKEVWTGILQKAGLPKCQVVIITDAVELSVIDVVAQLDPT